MGNRYYYERGDTYDEDDEWSNCSRTIDCSCEDCAQNYPERFDEDGNNIWAVDEQPPKQAQRGSVA